MNKTFQTGRLVRDPEIRYLPNGKPVLNFSIAVNDGYGDKKSVSYFDIVMFDKLAERYNSTLHKGSHVLLEGRLQQSRWEASDGSKRNKIEIVASNLQYLDKPDTPKEVNEDDIPF